jgi:hypothetical protein
MSIYDISGSTDASFNAISGNINYLASQSVMASDVYTLTPNEFKRGYKTTEVSGNTALGEINAPLSTTDDALQEDINTMLLQQNTLYTIGTLTAATFLVAAILLAK